MVFFAARLVKGDQFVFVVVKYKHSLDSA
jgi:hypothetical protein